MANSSKRSVPDAKAITSCLQTYTAACSAFEVTELITCSSINGITVGDVTHNAEQVTLEGNMWSKPFATMLVGVTAAALAHQGRAQTFNSPVSIAANVGGGASASNLAMLMTGNGSGTNGPATAQFGQNLSCSKTNWKTTQTVGEIDCLNIGLHQGGPGSDGSGLLVNVQNAGIGTVTDLDMTASSLNVKTNTVPLMMNLQLGVINATRQMFGTIVTAQNGVGDAALYVNAEGSASWATVIQAAKLGHIYFKVDNNGNMTTDGKIATASLTTSGSVQAEGGVVTSISMSLTVGRPNCGTTMRSVSKEPITLEVPPGLPIGCRIDVLQASDAPIAIHGRGVHIEQAGGGTTSADARTGGRFAEAQLTVDSAETILVDGDLEATQAKMADIPGPATPRRHDAELASLR